MSVPRILHYPGSKWSMADWIISHMPEHTTYLEPFFGSGAVLFNKEPAVLETVNDLDGDVVNLFRVVRERPEELAHALRWTPYARSEYLEAHEAVVDEIDQARRFLVRCWQSIRVKTGSISGWKCRGTPDDSYRIKQFNQLSDQILLVADRLKSCQIENRPALQVIERYNRPDVMIYADPLHTVTTKDRFGLVTIAGVDYQIVNIGMRMLEPHELFAAQGFPASYIIDKYANGKAVPKSAQVARCGNSVCPPLATALVRSNLPELCVGSGKVLAFERYAAPEAGQMALSL